MGGKDQLIALLIQCAIAGLQILVPKLKKKVKEIRKKKEE